MRVLYTKTFIKSLQKLETSLQEEVLLKVEQFKDIDNHKILKTHKLKGKLKDKYSFSVNYRFRILFKKEKNNYYFLDIGDHHMYQ